MQHKRKLKKKKLETESSMLIGLLWKVGADGKVSPMLPSQDASKLEVPSSAVPVA